MKSVEKQAKTSPAPDVLTKQEFSSLQKAEKELGTDDILLEVIQAVKNKEAWVEIKTSEETGLKSAIVRQGENIVFSTQDQGEVAALDLIRQGKNLILDLPSDK